KPIPWTLSFIPAYGMRGAGDVRFSMLVSAVTMWVCRVAVTMLLVHLFHMGPLAVWLGMFTDWTVRAVIFSVRYRSGRWLDHDVLSN
ncbi:MAG: MATE family efflux transporter, partial [Oscillospiraceae bacterium]|nr:MATE family efflux transporter [Oscillospiraceae bacterium]